MQSSRVLNGEPVLAEILLRITFLPQFVELGEYGGSEHVFDVDPPCAFGVEEEEKLTDSCQDVLFLESLVHALKMHKGGNQFRDVLLEVSLSEVAIAGSVVETDVNTGLEEVVLAHDGVEERLHVDAAVLVAVELEESGCTEEVPELERQLRSNGQEGVVVQSFLVIVWRRKVLSQ